VIGGNEDRIDCAMVSSKTKSVFGHVMGFQEAAKFWVTGVGRLWLVYTVICTPHRSWPPL